MMCLNVNFIALASLLIFYLVLDLCGYDLPLNPSYCHQDSNKYRPWREVAYEIILLFTSKTVTIHWLENIHMLTVLNIFP